MNDSASGSAPAPKQTPRTLFLSQALRNQMPYSEYAYGIYYGCQLARRLKLPRVSVIEFGVAGGNGLVAMEQHASEIERFMGVKVDVYGFDTGKGLTPPRDYRDLPYVFGPGNYEMDVPKLQARLTRGKLLLGEVATTASTFIEEYQPAPIAFVSFDMDYYSATMDSFSLFSEDIADSYFLPRIFMHFDDVVGAEINAYNEFIGELAAINDFNSSHASVKIGENRSFRSQPNNLKWHHESYIMHRFLHRLYGSYVFESREKTNAYTALRKREPICK